jgi:hypothetical protein
MNPIASIEATQMTRRAVRGSGPRDAVSDERRPGAGRPKRRARSAPFATVNLVC